MSQVGPIYRAPMRHLIRYAGSVRQTPGLRAFVLSAAILSACPASAIDWVNGLATGDFDDGASWVGGVAPTVPTDFVRFDSVGVPVAVQYDAVNPTNLKLNVLGSEITLHSFPGQLNTHTINGIGGTDVENNSTLTLGLDPNTPFNLEGGRFKVEGNSTVNVGFGSLLGTNSLRIGDLTGTGTINVDGVGSDFVASGQSYVAGVINISNGATGSINDLRLAQNEDEDALTGELNVIAGAQVGLGRFSAGVNATPGETATILVDGVGSTVTVGNSFALGASSDSVGSLTVSNGGVIQTGNLTSRIHATGSVNINTNGALNLTGDVEVFGGTIDFASTGKLVLASDKTLAVFNGGSVTHADDLNIDTSADIEVGDTGSRFEVDGVLTLTKGAYLRVFDGGLVTVAGLVTTDFATNVGPPPPEDGSVAISYGARLEFGIMSLIDYKQISYQMIQGAPEPGGASLAGDIFFSNVNALSSISPQLEKFSPSLVDITDVHLVNDGLLFGTGTVRTSLTNLIGRNVQVSAGEYMIFAGDLDNRGTLSNFGGQFFFDGAATLATGSAMNGRGQFTASGGWTSDGAMNFSAGLADIVGDVELTTNASINTAGGGVTSLFGGLVHNGAAVNTVAGSTLVIFGQATGSGSFTGAGTVQFVGGYAPGSSPAVVGFAGSVVLDDANTLTMELGGTGTGEFDRLEIAGDWSIDGVLDVLLINGFTPVVGDSFDLFDFGSVAGAFDAVNLPSLATNLRWDSSSLYSTGELRVAPLLPGDTDGDGDIDDADLGTSFANYTGPLGLAGGKTAADGDTDSDGDVDDADLGTSFSGYTGPLNAPGTVPEPGTLASLLIGGLAIARHRR